MNGIICINKPKGFTSFDVIAKMRGISRMRRIGHGGTLDPMATGVLPLFFGLATKASDMMPDDIKAYKAGFKLGISTDTQDITGTVLTSDTDFAGIDNATLVNVLKSFEGEIEQLPPMYSAVQVNGRRLYDLARQGIEVERKTRKATIHAICLEEFSPEIGEGTLNIQCSRGTYIRTIINDMGEILGCGATMTELVRTRSSGFTLEDCITIEQAQGLSEKGELEGKILSLDRVFEAYPKAVLDPKQAGMFKCGIRLDAGRVDFTGTGEIHTVYDENELIGLATINEKNELVIKQTFFIR